VQIKTEYEKSLEGKEGEERENIMKELHDRNAEKCLKLAQRNGGIYNKAAQFVASLQAGAGDRSIPKPYIDALKVNNQEEKKMPARNGEWSGAEWTNSSCTWLKRT